MHVSIDKHYKKMYNKYMENRGDFPQDSHISPQVFEEKIEMDLLHPIYKCRLCSEVIRPAVAYEASGSITCFDEALQILQKKQNVAHTCRTPEKIHGVFEVGICDLIGIRVVRDELAGSLTT